MPIESNRPLAALVATVVMIASVKLVSAQQGFDEEPAAAPSANSPHDSQPDSSQPDSSQPDSSQPDSSQPDSSRPCVLLRNDNVLFGSATQQGDYVIVQRGHGNEIRLPRGDVACWAGSIRNLYQYRVDHRPKGNLAALIKDAHWCLRYDLLDLAGADIRAGCSSILANPKPNVCNVSSIAGSHPTRQACLMRTRRPWFSRPDTAMICRI